jgi:GAF domain-containing protein
VSSPSGSQEIESVLSQAEARVASLVEVDAPLRAVLATLTSAAEAIAPRGSVASILVLDAEGLLRNGASPNLPSDYLDAIDRLRPHAEVGTCAAAAATGQPVLTPSFLNDRRWSELRHLPLALGFAGAWSQPILDADGGRVLGTFGTYFREVREPPPQERQAVARLALVAPQAIVHSLRHDSAQR